MATNNDADSLAAALEKLANSDIDAWVQDDAANAARQRAMTAVVRLRQKLESPVEISRRLGWQEPAHAAAIQIALDLKLFEELQKDSSAEEGVPVTTLAKNVNAPQELVERVLRHLGANGIVKETGPDQYAATRISNAFLDPVISSGIGFYFHLSAPTFGHLPQYIREGGYNEIYTPGKGNFQASMGSGQDIFQWMAANKDAQKMFANHMVGMVRDRVDWTKLYPAQERLLSGADPEGALFVDVGGGVGHDAEQFQARFHQPKERVIVQDQPQVVVQAAADVPMEMQAHDFFTPNPVKGARAYFMHYILHDWADAEALAILGHLRDAMRKGYSKLLVHEFVVATQNADLFNTSLDMVMMSMVSSKERTEVAWKELFQKARLRIAGVFSLPGINESVIELVRDDE